MNHFKLINFISSPFLIKLKLALALGSVLLLLRVNYVLLLPLAAVPLAAPLAAARFCLNSIFWNSNIPPYVLILLII